MVSLATPTLSLWLYTALILATALERLVEVRLSNRNAAWSLARGGVETGRGHFPAMVALHSGFLIACAAEAWLGAPFVPTLGWPMLGLAAACQGLRWWVITTLGHQWNTRVIVVPGLPRIRSGPYRWLAHPNYLAVILEGAALPLIHGAWRTAMVFTLLNALLLRVRVRAEDAALARLSAP
jgi:methyltransferase